MSETEQLKRRIESLEDFAKGLQTLLDHHLVLIKELTKSVTASAVTLDCHSRRIGCIERGFSGDMGP